MAKPIPTHLITGFLGVGKTTVVLDLLRRKPASEKWAVLVNEYGQVSIDEAFIEGEAVAEGVAVRSVAGGCFCCTTSPQLLLVDFNMLYSNKEVDSTKSKTRRSRSKSNPKAELKEVSSVESASEIDGDSKDA